MNGGGSTASGATANPAARSGLVYHIDASYFVFRAYHSMPSDMVDRGPGTIICDLNIRPLPDLGSGTYDVAVLLGVLEYLRDVPSFLDWGC